MKSVQVLAIIPARGGSKSVPRKNIIVVQGHPLIAYTIRHGLGCTAIHRTMVSTDDDEIAEIAHRYGAEVPFRRPPEFATDDATDLDVFRHALSWLRDQEGYVPDLVVHLRVTSPVRSSRRVAEAIDMMLAHPEADSLRSIHLASHTPYKMWALEGEYLRPALSLAGCPEAHSMPRQKLPPIYAHNGYVDIIRPRTVLEMNSMVGSLVLPFFVDREVPDLDYPHQLLELERAMDAQPPSLIPVAARAGSLRRIA